MGRDQRRAREFWPSLVDFLYNTCRCSIINQESMMLLYSHTCTIPKIARSDCNTSQTFLEDMEICEVPSLTKMLLFFYFIFLLHPLIALSTLQLSAHPHRHPHLSNASDQHALIGFMSAITYDPSLSLRTKHNISFFEWTGVICSGRRQRMVSLNVSSMALQGTISPLLTNLSFLRILDLSDNHFHGHIPYQLGNLF